MTTQTLIISSAFIADRESRDMDCGTLDPHGPRGTGKLCLQVTAETGADIMDDAAYQGWFTDAPSGIVRAARTAFRDCARHGFTYRHGTRERDGLLVPGDYR